MPVSYMRSAHMKLLLDWGNEVVRENVHTFRAYDGKVYPISLTGTCLSCHSKDRFCDQCHNYVGVAQPNCWNCHVDPELAAKDAR